jgi:hypothetical protein
MNPIRDQFQTPVGVEGEKGSVIKLGMIVGCIPVSPIIVIIRQQETIINAVYIQH